MKIDETDRQILNILLDDSRLSLREIAKKAKVSPVTAMNRIKSLETQGVIKSYTTRIDYTKANYDIDVIIKVLVGKGRLIEVEEKIAKDKNVSAVYDMTGDFDIMIIAKFQTRRLLDAFIKKLQTYPFVERTETSLILNTIKEGFIKVE